MEKDSEKESTNPPEAHLCRSGCGSYAKAGHDGLCSKCYKKWKQFQAKLKINAQADTIKIDKLGTHGNSMETDSSSACDETLENRNTPEGNTTRSTEPNPVVCGKDSGFQLVVEKETTVTTTRGTGDDHNKLLPEGNDTQSMITTSSPQTEGTGDNHNDLLPEDNDTQTITISSPQDTTQNQDMNQINTDSNSPTLCLTGCGFYGSPDTNWVCSACYKLSVNPEDNKQSENINTGTCDTSLIPSLSQLASDVITQYVQEKLQGITEDDSPNDDNSSSDDSEDDSTSEPTVTNKLDSDESYPLQWCRTGCGFYGTRNNNWLCSACYKQSTYINNAADDEYDSEHEENDSEHEESDSEHEENDSEQEEHDETMELGEDEIEYDENDAEDMNKSKSLENDPKLHIQDNTAEEQDKESKKRAHVEEYKPTSSLTFKDAITTKNETVTSSRGEKKRKAKLVCALCEKDLGIFGINCRCGGTYCPEHLYSDKHNCTFDYKALGAKQIKRDNPQVQASKIRKI